MEAIQQFLLYCPASIIITTETPESAYFCILQQSDEHSCKAAHQVEIPLLHRKEIFAFIVKQRETKADLDGHFAGIPRLHLEPAENREEAIELLRDAGNRCIAEYVREFLPLYCISRNKAEALQNLSFLCDQALHMRKDGSGIGAWMEGVRYFSKLPFMTGYDPEPLENLLLSESADNVEREVKKHLRHLERVLVKKLG